MALDKVSNVMKNEAEARRAGAWKQDALLARPRKDCRTRSRAQKLACLALALPLLAGRCSPSGERHVPKNVIVIVIDALRADRLGCYGHDRATSPTIDRFASEGVLFEQAFAQCSFTPPAIASLLTGRHVPSHRLLGWQARLPESETTLAEVLQASGYRTAAFVFLHLLTKQGLGQGFDSSAEMVAPADSVFLLAREWIEREPGRPFFLLLHCYDVHRPYKPVAPYDTMFGAPYIGTLNGSNRTLDDIRKGAVTPAPVDHQHLVDLYDGEIRYTDDRLGEFARWLSEQRLLDTSLLVITADHGEMLADRPDPTQQYMHDEALYDPVMHIPLILRHPGTLTGGIRVAEQVRQIDIMPTIIALLGVEPPPGIEGVSLVSPAGTLHVESRRAFADAFPDGRRASRYLRAVRDPDFKLIQNMYAGRWEKYDLRNDCAEATNLWVGPPDSLQDALLAHAESAGEVQEICIAWCAEADEVLTGSLVITRGRIIDVSRSPDSRPVQYTIAPDGQRVDLHQRATGERSAVCVRVSPPGIEARIAFASERGRALPITIYQRGRVANGPADFRLPDIGHAHADPFVDQARGVYVFGRAWPDQPGLPVTLEPEDIERLKALGYIGR